MDPLEYVLGASDDWGQYVALLVVAGVLHWFVLLRRRTFGFFDPLFIILLGGAFGWAIVWFMFLRGDIAAVYAASFTVTELAFWGGLYAGGRRNHVPPPRTASDEPPGFAIAVFLPAAALHVGGTLAIWALVGIPLFQVSRLGAFVGSGGLGLLERLADAGGTISLFTALYLAIGNARTRRRFGYYLFFAWYTVATALSGSKSALLVIGQCVFAVAFLYTGLGRRQDGFWGGKVGKAFIGVATAFAVLVLVVQQDADLSTAFAGMAFRLVSFGDIYIYAYVDRTIELLRGDNPLVGLFGGFLSTFRLFPVEEIHTNIGYQFTLLTFPDLDYIAGPNPRHSVFGYHYFGAFAFVYSFLLGWLTSRVQRSLYFPGTRDFLRTLLAYAAYSALVSVSVDFDYSLSRLASMIIGFCLVLPPALLLFPRQRLPRMPRRPLVTP